MKRWIAVAGVIAFIIAALLTNSRWDRDITEGAAQPLAAKTGAQVTNLLPWNLQGDLQLFIFFSGGTAAGFAAGYYWHKIFAAGSISKMEADRASKDRILTNAPGKDSALEDQAGKDALANQTGEI